MEERGIGVAVAVLIIIIVTIVGIGAYIATRPQPDFQVENLSLSSDTVAKGEPVSASVNVANVGDAKGTHTVSLEIGDETLKKKVTLESGESQTVSFDIEKEKKGTYNLNVGDSSKNLEVVEPAEFEFSNLSVSPSEVEQNQDVEISVDVKNIGEAEGTHTVDLEVNGAIENTKNVTLNGGEDTTVSFTVKKKIKKSYSVGVGKLTDSFEVGDPSEFKVQNLNITPSAVKPRETVDITVDVKNVGDLTGDYKVQLEIGEDIKNFKTVTLDGGKSTSVRFGFTPSANKLKRNVKVNSLSGTLIVEKPRFDVSNLRVDFTNMETNSWGSIYRSVYGHEKKFFFGNSLSDILYRQRISISQTQEVSISADIKNTGTLKGEYTPKLKFVPSQLKDLYEGFELTKSPITLEEGQSKTISFSVTPKDTPNDCMFKSFFSAAPVFCSLDYGVAGSDKPVKGKWIVSLGDENASFHVKNIGGNVEQVDIALGCFNPGTVVLETTFYHPASREPLQYSVKIEEDNIENFRYLSSASTHGSTWPARLESKVSTETADVETTIKSRGVYKATFTGPHLVRHVHRFGVVGQWEATSGDTVTMKNVSNKAAKVDILPKENLLVHTIQFNPGENKTIHPEGHITITELIPGAFDVEVEHVGS